MHVYYDNNEIQGSPYTINIRQGSLTEEQLARRVVASGSGTKKGNTVRVICSPQSTEASYISSFIIVAAFVDERSQFTVDSSQGGEGQLTARMYSFNDKADVDIEKRSNGMYNCSYVAHNAGQYTMHMYWNNKEIRDR